MFFGHPHLRTDFPSGKDHWQAKRKHSVGGPDITFKIGVAKRLFLGRAHTKLLAGAASSDENNRFDIGVIDAGACERSRNCCERPECQDGNRACVDSLDKRADGFAITPALYALTTPNGDIGSPGLANNLLRHWISMG